MKHLIAALAIALVAFPATALAVPDELRHSGGQQPSSAPSPSTLPSYPSPLRQSHLRTPDQRTAPAVPSPLRQSHLRTPDQQTAPAVPQDTRPRGTDVAAPDQQAPIPTGAPAPAPPENGFDWTDAGIGAGGAITLFAISLAAAVTLRRRNARSPSALAG